ncbi:hypothetical protein [Actinosynnema sp. NPDC020468]|uniref:hypothetical protein n=1 Tax=Actinosynnema sp. NPDC020468 TaxID=3154488 RepID=UPI0033CAB6E7
MTGEDAAERTRREAHEVYRADGSGLVDLLTLGAGEIVATTRSLAAAARAGALAVDPHVVDAMVRQLTDMRDALDRLALDTRTLGVRTPLGRGYAEAVGELNADLGRELRSRLLPEVARALDELTAEIARSRDSYRNVDSAQAGTFDHG